MVIFNTEYKSAQKLIQNSSLWKSTTTAYSDTQGCWISPDGTKLIVGYWNNGKLVQYNLSTPFDVSSKGSIESSLTPSIGTCGCGGIWFNDTGTVLFFEASGQAIDGGKIIKYTLSTAWDLRTATVAQNSGAIGYLTSIFVGDNGKKIYYNSYGDYIRRQATMSTAYDLSTMGTATTVNINNYYRGISFSSDGKYVFLSNSDADGNYGTIYQYKLSIPRYLTSEKTAVSTYTATGGDGCAFWMSEDMQYRTWSSGNRTSNIEIYKIS